MYDCGLCIYIIIVIFGLVWSNLGYSWASDADPPKDSNKECPDTLKTITTLSCIIY